MANQSPGGGSVEPGTAYHRWYYNNRVWERTTWLGVQANKSVSDLWLYQELISARSPGAVIEFGTGFGGSTLFLASVLDVLGTTSPVLTVDVDHGLTHPAVGLHPRVRMLTCSSISERVASALRLLRGSDPGTWFVILDSDHTASHVRAELELLHPLLEREDYLVVEDTNINGNPVLPEFGPGPHEALMTFIAQHGMYYRRDRESESKFGFTFAPDGFLVRL